MIFCTHNPDIIFLVRTCGAPLLPFGTTLRDDNGEKHIHIRLYAYIYRHYRHCWKI